MGQYSSKSLAVKYRPKTFAEIVGQSTITDILQNQIKTKTFRNTVLFTGPAGCGKTTSARAFATLLNQGKGKPIEIDAASNNGVDNVRDIIVKAQQKSLDSEYKVFILDEVHMLSTGAWNALLKLIEEPPANTIFIFCTTDAQKIPATIISRVQRFDFKRISFENIVNRLKHVIYNERRERLINELTQQNLTDDQIDIQLCQAEDSDYFDVDEDAIAYIAKTADGGMRDSLTLLDKAMAYSNELTLVNVIKALGSVDYTVFFNLTNAILDYKEKEVINIIETCYREGSDIKQFVKNYTIFLLDVCKYCICKDFTYIQIPETYKNELSELVNDKDFIKYLLSEINKLNSEIKWEASVKSIVELKLLALTQPENN